MQVMWARTRIYRESISHTELRITSIARNALLQFWELIELLVNLSHSKPIGKIVEVIIERTNFKSYVERLDDSETIGKRRVDRLSILQVIANSYTDKHGIAQSTLLMFLQDIALVSNQENGMGKETESTVKLMTLHAAKGLEFDCVFITGLQEDVLPLSDGNLDEERRLLYVGVTRAMQRLYLTFSIRDNMLGKPLKARPSRFVEELLKSPELKVVD